MDLALSMAEWTVNTFLDIPFFVKDDSLLFGTELIDRISKCIHDLRPVNFI